MMKTKIDNALDINNPRSIISESFAAMPTSQEYVDRLVASMLYNASTDDDFVTSLITSQNEIDLLVDELLQVAVPAAS